MKKLVLGSLLLVIASTGCIIVDDDDGGGDFATISATWSIETIAGSKATCPPNGRAAVLVEQLVDSQLRPIGLPSSDVFDCANGSGVSDPLEPGVYQVWVRIADCADFANCTPTSPKYAESTSAIVDVTTSDKTFMSTIFTDGGYFELDWDLKGAQSNTPLQCSQVAGLTSIEVLSTISGPGQSVTDKFMTCENHHGVTSAMLQGTYTVSVEALQGNGSLGKAPDNVPKMVTAPNNVTDLGLQIIAIDGQ